MPTTYLSPGVYVEEVPSGSAPIVGVGTSTAGFIGVIAPKEGTEPAVYHFGKTEGEKVGIGDGQKTVFDLSKHPVSRAAGTFKVKVKDAGSTELTERADAEIVDDTTKTKSQVKFTNAPDQNAMITVDYELTSTPTQEVKLCTNFGEFKKFFGDFSELPGQNILAHAVYGFFRNGGTRCYVVWVTDNDKVKDALEKFEAIDEIAIVAAPGITNKSVLSEIDTHCRQMTKDRVAIFDSLETVDDLNSLKPGEGDMPGNSDYAALYFPWIQVLDPATNKEKYVPPSGHIAGIYARVDTQRGVHKAPANETLLGAVGLKENISKAKQDGLNPQGINCIRNLNGNIKVWGARTLGGDANGEFKYINVRRLFNYMRESIDEGTQWTVFEPNSPELWARIRRNITAFLTTVWRSGALFGDTPEQAFFVKCDEETNPPEVRDLGQVVTVIGVAVVKPAEFVIFRISQWAGPGAS